LRLRHFFYLGLTLINFGSTSNHVNRKFRRVISQPVADPGPANVGQGEPLDYPVCLWVINLVILFQVSMSGIEAPPDTSSGRSIRNTRYFGALSNA
jgi:hypothetical protein